MPKVARTADPAMEEAPVSKLARMSNSSSPVVPHLSIHLSPQRLEESSEVPEEDSPYNAFPLLSPPENRHSSVASPGVLSPHLTICLNSKPDKVDLGKDPSSFDENASSVSQQTPSEEVASFSEQETMDTSNESLGNAHQNCKSLLGKDVWKDYDQHETEDCVDESGDNRKDRQMVSGDKPDSLKGPNCSDLRPDRVSRSEKETEGTTPCPLTGYVTLAARNGDSLLHGVLPPVFPSHQGPALNTCFPGSDGNWYQILSASLPPLLSSQPQAEKENKPQTSSLTSAHCAKDSSAAYHPLSLLSGLSLPTSGAATLSTGTTTSASIVAPLPSPAPSPDPLLSLLQQYTTGTACGTDLQPPLSALHMPLNLASAAVAAAASGAASSHISPRYMYATNPRTGQLLILSSVGELAGTQPLHLQSQLPLQPVLQLQQQQMKMQEKSWKSPLRLKQCQNNLATSITSGLAAAGKQAPKPISVVSKLLQSKFPCSLGSSRKHDENLPSVAAARDLLALATPAHAQGMGQSAVPSLLFNTSPDVKPTDEPVRENHNMKERRRRARIKDACDLMRQLVPGMSEKTDKATVFEFSARYIHFLKNFVGTHHDKDFLIKYSPY